MLDSKTLEKYTNIIKGGKTLKETKDVILEVVSSDEDLSKLLDQTGKPLTEDTQLKNVSEKIIVKLPKYSDIIYWSICTVDDLLKVIGATDYSDGKYKIEFIRRENQINFFGKDIKRAFENCKDNLNPVLNQFIETYINSEHPIADGIFYTLYVKEANGLQSINCSRNVSLSPRPVKNANQ